MALSVINDDAAPAVIKPITIRILCENMFKHVLFEYRYELSCSIDMETANVIVSMADVRKGEAVERTILTPSIGSHLIS